MALRCLRNHETGLTLSATTGTALLVVEGQHSTFVDDC